MEVKFSSTDETVNKRVIKHGKISNKPVDGSIVHLHIEDVQVIPEESINLSKLNSKILTQDLKNVVFTVDEVVSEVDRQIERAIKWMGENETACIRVMLPSMLEKLEKKAKQISTLKIKDAADNEVDKVKSNEGDQDKEEKIQTDRSQFDFREYKINNDTPVIKFKATLVKHEPNKPIWDWTPNEKYEKAAKYKEMAVDLVHEDRIKDAFWRFSKAVKIIITLEPIEDLDLDETLFRKLYNLRTNIYNNMAMCQLTYNNYDHTVSLCSKVLERDKNNVKAMYRRGCAHAGNRDFEKSLNDFQKTVHIQPTNSAAWARMKSYSEILAEATKRNNQLLKKMFKNLIFLDDFREEI